MGACGRDLQPVLRSQFRQLSAKIDNLLPGITRVAANLGAQFYDRLVQLGFDAVLQNHFAVRQNLLDMRPQLPRLRIDDLKFFLDPESKNVVFHHFGLQCSMRSQKGRSEQRKLTLLFERGVTV
jgi:hypothetical protein